MQEALHIVRKVDVAITQEEVEDSRRHPWLDGAMSVRKKLQRPDDSVLQRRL